MVLIEVEADAWYSQQRTSSIFLIDEEKPGRCRIIKLWLVNPSTRIVSTANVPPQRLDWWAGAVGAHWPTMAANGNVPSELLRAILRDRLPQELIDMVGKQGVVPDLLFFDRNDQEGTKVYASWIICQAVVDYIWAHPCYFIVKDFRDYLDEDSELQSQAETCRRAYLGI